MKQPYKVIFVAGIFCKEPKFANMCAGTRSQDGPIGRRPCHLAFVIQLSQLLRQVQDGFSGDHQELADTLKVSPYCFHTAFLTYEHLFFHVCVICIVCRSLRYHEQCCVLMCMLLSCSLLFPYSIMCIAIAFRSLSFPLLACSDLFDTAIFRPL